MGESAKNQTHDQAKNYQPKRTPQALKVLVGHIPDERMNKQMGNRVSKSPVKRKVGGVFVPVRDVQKAKEWYCKMLGIPEEGEVQFGHLYVLPMEGLDLILDEMPRWGGENEKGAPPYETPAFMFQTDNIQAAYEHIKALEAELVTEIENNHWFAFRDPDGNLLMICR